jgi:phage terminase large subunit
MSTRLELRGDNYAATTATEHEFIVSGPRDTGKTIACCFRLNMIATMLSEAQLGLVRKTQASMVGTVLQTWHQIIRNKGVKMFGKSSPYRYDYPNGSVVWVAGMDNPGKLLSSERDAIYVNQAEELLESDWDTLSACCSGRGRAMANPQIFGDCNPGPRNHWIRKRAEQGKLRLLVARHQDNPALFTPEGVMTEEGRLRLKVLSDQTGVQRLRMFLGEWATAEGAVYQFSRLGHLELDDVTKLEIKIGPHVVDRKPEEMKRWFIAMDQGFDNPAVILLVGADCDGRWHVFREFHKRGVLPSVWTAIARDWFREKGCELAAVDAASAGPIADLIDLGVNAQPGKGRIEDGVDKIRNRLACAGDGLPRLTVDRSCEETINEFESYIMEPGRDKPRKENDHSMDALRYLADVLGEPTGAISTAKGIHVGSNDPRLSSGPRVFVPRHFEPRRLG